MTTEKFSYETTEFSAPIDRVIRWSNLIMRHISIKSNLRVLDIGCGSGEQVFSLGAQLAESQLVGVDLSLSNIEKAKQAAKTTGEQDRFDFVLGDYLEYNDEAKFDLIISYSTLHLIPVSTERLFEKLSLELLSNGLLIFTIPRVCFYNNMLHGLRRFFRLIKGPFTDKIIFLAGKIITGNNMPEGQLKDRVLYMYLLSNCLDGVKLRAIAARHGLHVIKEYPEPHASIAQLKHNCVVMQKLGS